MRLEHLLSREETKIEKVFVSCTAGWFIYRYNCRNTDEEKEEAESIMKQTRLNLTVL